MYQISKLFLARDISHGVQPMLYAMTGEGATGGVLYGPKYIHHLGPVAEMGAYSAAYEADTLKRFWEVSEELTGVTYGVLENTNGD